MTVDDPILRELTEADPCAGPVTHEPAEAERVLRRALAPDASPDGVRSRPRRRALAIGLATVSVLVVAAVVAVVAAVGQRGSTSAPAGYGRIVTLTYRVGPAVGPPRVGEATVRRELAVIRARVAGERARVEVQRVGADGVRIVISGHHLTDAAVSAVQQRATAPGMLAFYDWEADALLPDGRTVASQLPARNPLAIRISQGGDGGAGLAGGVTHGEALRIASAHKRPSNRTVVLSSPRAFTASRGPAHYFALADHVALANRGIRGARAVTENGEPQVELTLTGSGARRFQNLTATVAHRGQQVSVGATHLFQHFAVAVDDRLLSIPEIDFTKYPDGVVGQVGQSMTVATDTGAQARRLAAILRAGPLPLPLTLTGRVG